MIHKTNRITFIHNRISKVVDREQYFALKIRTILREPGTVSQVWRKVGLSDSFQALEEFRAPGCWVSPDHNLKELSEYMCSSCFSTRNPLIKLMCPFNRQTASLETFLFLNTQ